MTDPSIDPPRPPGTRLRGPAYAWVWFAGVALLMVALVAFTLQQSARDAERREGERLQVQARVVAENMLQQIEGIDAALRGVRDDIVQPPEAADSPSALIRHVIAVTDALPGLRTLLVTDASGRVVAASRQDLIGIRVADRPYFTEARKRPDRDVLHVAPPFRTVDEDRWVTALSRTMRDSKGQFAGVVVASLDADYFHVVMRSVLYSDDMRSTLVHGGGRVFVTRPPSRLGGSDLERPGSFFSRHREAGETASLLTGIAAITGEERMVASRTLQRAGQPIEPPLVIQVSRSLDAIYAPWRSQRDVLVGILVVAAIGGAGTLLFTQRRRREYAALEESVRREREDSSRRIRTITDSLPALVAYFDSDRRYRFANAYYRTFFKLDPEGLVGRRLEDMLGPVYAEVEPYVEKALRGEACSHERHAVERGLDVYLRAEYVPDIEPGGRVAGFYAMTLDITQAKQSELQRCASERRLRAITDNLPVLITYIDAGEHLRFVNATFKDWTGMEVADAHGRTVADVIGPDGYAQRSEYLKRALRGERVEFELAWRCGGVERHLHNVYIPDVGDDAGIAGIYTLSSDVTSMKTVERKLFALAHVDSLTGLSNRAHFNQNLADALARADRSGDAIALMFLDIDYFKRINDTFGHPAGDAVLKEVAARLLNVVRRTDSVARFAGDEFVVIFEGLHGGHEVQRIASKVLQRLGRPIALPVGELSISASIGIAFHAGPSITPAELLAKADEGLYEAKGAGRNRVVFMPSDLRDPRGAMPAGASRATLPAPLDDTTH